MGLPRRETRRIKAGSFAISFGTLMLPLVCMVAIGLLIVTGKIFLSGFQASGQPVPAAAAFFAAPRASAEGKSGAGTNAINQNELPQSSEPAQKEKIVVVVPAPPAPQTRPKPSTKPVESKPAVSKPQQPVQRSKPVRTAGAVRKPNTAAWMVQAGAYSTKDSADSVVKTLAQAGHTAAVFSDKTLHKVMVQAGSTKQEAYSLAARLDKAGFPGAFVVEPTS